MKNLKWPKLGAILWYPLSQKLLILAVGMIIIMVVGIFAIFGYANILATFNNILASTLFINALTIISVLLAILFRPQKTMRKEPPVVTTPPEPNIVVVSPPIKPTEKLLKDTSSNLSFVSNSTNKYDIFVSYATEDNNWATSLINNLQGYLGKELGSEYSIWMDDVLTGNTSDTNKLEKSAILLIILSQSYLDSKRCQSELETFLTKNKSGDVFIIYNEVQPPTNFIDLISDNAHNFFHHLPEFIYDKQEYYRKIIELAEDLTDKLKKLKTQPNNNSVRKTIFLTGVTNDLEKDRDQFEQLFKQQGYDVLPCRSDLFSEKYQSHGYKEDIKKSVAFVQLLSYTESKIGLFDPCSQYQCAMEAGQPILQWRNKYLNVETVTNDKYKELLDSDTVMAIPIEEFRREVLQEIKKVKVNQTELEGNNMQVNTCIEHTISTQQHLSSFWIFVNAIQADEPFAQKLIKYIFDKHNISCISPIYKIEDPRKLRREHEKNMRHCHAMVVVYGKSEPEWICDQFRDLHKFSSQNNAQQCLLPGGAVCEVPPLPKEPLNISFQSFRCTDESLEENINNFLDELRKHA